MSKPTVLLRHQVQSLIDELEGAMAMQPDELQSEASIRNKRWLSYVHGRLKELTKDEPIAVPMQAADSEETTTD